MLTLRSAPSVSVLERFDCIFFWGFGLVSKAKRFGRLTSNSVGGALLRARGLKITEIEVNAFAVFVFDKALEL